MKNVTETKRFIDLSKVIDFRKVSLNTNNNSIFCKNNRPSLLTEGKKISSGIFVDSIEEPEGCIQPTQVPCTKTSLKSAYQIQVFSELLPNEPNFRNVIDSRLNKCRTFCEQKSSSSVIEITPKKTGHPQCKGDFADTFLKLDIGEGISEGEAKKAVGKLKVPFPRFIRNDLSKTVNTNNSEDLATEIPPVNNPKVTKHLPPKYLDQ